MAKETTALFTKSDMRPLFRMIDGKKVQICAHHENLGDRVVMYNENMEQIDAAGNVIKDKEAKRTTTNF